MLLLALSADSSHDAVSLPDQARVGRLSGVELRIDEPTVSRDHARFSWTGSHWTLRDLASTSGTFVAGRRIRSGTEIHVDADDTIRFGGGPELVVLCADAPEPTPKRPGTLAIVRKQGARFVLSQSSRGPADRASETVEMTCGRTIATATLVLKPTRDWEDVHAQIRTSTDDVVDLGKRSAHMLLYVLARHAVDEHGTTVLSRPEEGWLHVDLVERRVGEGRKWVNTSLFRMREELRRLAFVDPEHLVVRDDTSHRLRIGVQQVELLPAA